MVRILNTGVSKAQEIMSLDENLLENLNPDDEPILHLYEWEGPSATFGYFIDPVKHLNLAQAEKHGISLARRPTGGGIVFHVWDLAFSFLLPARHPYFSVNTLDNYRFVNQIVLEAAMETFLLGKTAGLTPESFPSLGFDCQNFCMAKPTQYDVVYEGKKIAGAAQRRRKQGYLHQGTISLAIPDFELLSAVLLSNEEVVQAMQAYTFAFLGPNCSKKELGEARGHLQQLLILKFSRVGVPHPNWKDGVKILHKFPEADAKF